MPPSSRLSPPRRAASALRIQLECQGGLKFADLALDELRLYLKGESETVASLYELIFNHALDVVFRDPGGRPVRKRGRGNRRRPAVLMRTPRTGAGRAAPGCQRLEKC